MPNCTAKYGKDFVNCKYTTGCLHKDWFCDGDDDCWDNSDETNCSSIKVNYCGRDEFRCGNGSCVNITVRCDGNNDCNDMDLNSGVSSDEMNCGIGKKAYSNSFFLLMEFFLGHQCRYNEYLCEIDSICIPLAWHCNGVPNCSDQSDELDCSKYYIKCTKRTRSPE